MSVQTSIGIGTEFVGYRIEAPVGQGGMGVVYRACDLRLKRDVALKLVAPELALDERFRERFSRESELAMSLEHPNVVPIYDAGEVDGRLYLAMRYVEGTDLRARLRDQGALDPSDAVSVAKQVAHALDAAHAKGLVHRDVKPSNVLLDRSGHAYLADFGLTRRLEEQGAQFSDGRSLGTPAYLAPEQIEGRPVDGRADVYSLGCMLYECLTGSAPFSPPSRLAMVWAHLEEEPPSASEGNRSLPRPIDAVIRRAMAKQPQDRYRTCGELAAAAERALGLGGAAVAGRRKLLAVAVAILVTLAAFATALATRSGAEPASSAGPVVKADTLVRIDPATNTITSVIGVGPNPVAAAAAGNSIWVYNFDSASVSEIDAVTEEVHTTAISAPPGGDPSALQTGPVLAADANGAWLVGYALGNRYTLTHIRSGGTGKREYRLRHYPIAVAAGESGVWVLISARRRDEVLRIDPGTGRVTRRLPVGDAVLADGLAVGDGVAWVMESDGARLHRIDLRSGVTRMRDLGSVGAAPVLGLDSVWMCVANPGSSMIRIDSRTFRNRLEINSLPAEDGRLAAGYGSLWRHDVPSGTVMRFDPDTGEVVGTVRVSPTPPTYRRGITPTAIAIAGGSVWVTVANV